MIYAPPALLAMVTLLQASLQGSDAEAGELSVMDRRGQLVLACLEVPEPLFSQGALGELRVRLLRTDRDRRRLERTVAVARQSKAFAPGKLPTTLREACDASALEGAGRVEDTSNLLGHAARKVVACGAVRLGGTTEAVARQAGNPVLLAPSGKAGRAVEWPDPQAPAEALERLGPQLEALEAWGQRRLPAALPQAPLQQVPAQDLEPQPAGQGGRLRQGVAPERRCSREDAELRQRVEGAHRLAHLGARQARRARYKGVRKNLFDVRRTAAVLNLQTLQPKTEEQQWRMAAEYKHC